MDGIYFEEGVQKIFRHIRTFGFRIFNSIIPLLFNYVWNAMEYKIFYILK